MTRSKDTAQVSVHEAVGQKVALERRKRGISQRALAAAVNMTHSGTDWNQGVLSDVENGKRKLSLIEAAALAEVLDVSITALVPWRVR